MSLADRLPCRRCLCHPAREHVLSATFICPPCGRLPAWSLAHRPARRCLLLSFGSAAGTRCHSGQFCTHTVVYLPRAQPCARWLSEMACSGRTHGKRPAWVLPAQTVSAGCIGRLSRCEAKGLDANLGIEFNASRHSAERGAPQLVWRCAACSCINRGHSTTAHRIHYPHRPASTPRPQTRHALPYD